MTLLESVVAFVIVGLAAVGFLNLFEGEARLPAAAREWTNAVSYAEEGMELAKLGQSTQGLRQDGLSRRIERRPFAAHVEEIRVVVTMADGATFEIRRLAAGR